MNKVWHVYIKWNIIQLQKRKILSFVTTEMDLERESFMLSETSQRNKNIICATPIICAIQKDQKKKKAANLIDNREEICGCQGIGWGMG